MYSRRFLRAVPLAAACIAVLAVPAATQPAARDPRLHELIAVPQWLNYGLRAVSPRVMEQQFGRPGTLTEDCSSLQNPRISSMIVTRHVGRLRLEGLEPAVATVERVLERVRTEQPALFASLGTKGMLCVRRVRKEKGETPSRNFSNHSWATAIDFTVNGQLDPVGDRKTQRGLLMLYPYFRAEGFYWGAAFKTKEDSMHFEASDAVIRGWLKTTAEK
jgi:hypothetical protein